MSNSLRYDVANVGSGELNEVGVGKSGNYLELWNIMIHVDAWQDGFLSFEENEKQYKILRCMDGLKQLNRSKRRKHARDKRRAASKTPAGKARHKVKQTENATETPTDGPSVTDNPTQEVEDDEMYEEEEPSLEDSVLQRLKDPPIREYADAPDHGTKNVPIEFEVGVEVGVVKHVEEYSTTIIPVNRNVDMDNVNELEEFVDDLFG